MVLILAHLDSKAYREVPLCCEPLRRRRVGACLAVLLVSVATAAATQAQIPASQAPADEEPITSVPAPPDADPLRLALGERLFADPRLSRTGSRNCVSCHDVGTNGASGQQRDNTPNGAKLPFNTSTVFNAALSFRLMWEGKFRSLEAQVEASLQNPDIMGTSIDEVVGRLSAYPHTVRQFRVAYGHGPDRASLLDAIATYERSLLTPGSRFDRWLGGDAAVLSSEEQNGYQL
jgi:cytochrome c peroxidase